MINLFREVLRRSARAILLTGAVLYFLIDLIFLSVVRPLRRRIMALSWMRKSREWVGNLNRYANNAQRLATIPPLPRHLRGSARAGPSQPITRMPAGIAVCAIENANGAYCPDRPSPQQL